MSASVKTCDLLVVGAGPAGLAAAVTAARLGVQTLLVEKTQQAGGTPGLCAHGQICGLYPQAADFPPGPLNPGLTGEILSALGGQPEKMGRLYVHPLNPEHWRDLSHRLLADTNHLEPLFQANVHGCRKAREKMPDTVILHHRRHRLAVRFGAVIDCSTNGVVLKSCGAGYAETPPGKRQLAGFAAMISGLAGPDELTPLRVPYVLRQAVNEGKLPDYLRYTTFFPGPTAQAGTLKINLPAANGPHSLDTAQKAAAKVHQELSRRLPGFRHSRLKALSGHAVPRESPRLKGDYILTADDILQARTFSDRACRGGWPLELWQPHQGLKLRYLTGGSAYDIPRRCLTTREVPNLLVAGRLLSTSRRAQGATRVMGTCLATGEEAGRLAAGYLGRG